MRTSWHQTGMATVRPEPRFTTSPRTVISRPPVWTLVISGVLKTETEGEYETTTTPRPPIVTLLYEQGTRLRATPSRVRPKRTPAPTSSRRQSAGLLGL